MTYSSDVQRPVRQPRCVLAWLLPLAGAVAFGQDQPAFTHANFVAGDRSMSSQVEFPDIDTDIEITVTCTGRATAKGRLRDALCSAPDDPDLEFTMAVSRRFNSVRLVPATVNGEAEEVDFQFIVHFKKEGENETVNVYPNNGKNVDRLGIDYYSAQRYSPYVWPSRCRGGRQSEFILEAAIIGVDGRPRDVNVIAGGQGLPASCQAGLISQLEDGRWIPASYRGKPVEAVWVNPIVMNSVTFKRQQ